MTEIKNSNGFSAEEIADFTAVFDAVNIELPRFQIAKKRILALMHETERLNASNRARLEKPPGHQGKLDELWVLPIIGPSGATKSKTIQRISDPILAAHAGTEDVPILIVTLESNIRSTRQLQAAILLQFGETSASKVLTTKGYSEAEVNDAIREVTRERKTTIIVLDEAHNMLTYDAGRMAVAMAKALRSLVNNGVASIVLMGTEEVYPLIRDKELRSRLKDTEYFDAAEITDAKSVEEFLAFSQEFLEALYKAGALDGPEPQLFNHLDDCATLFDMAEGIHGQVVRLLRRAYERALMDSRKELTWLDIAASFQNHNRTLERKIFDPFKNGPRDHTVRMLKPLF